MFWKKPVRKEKKLETAEFLVDLAAVLRPKRISAPGETVVRFRRNVDAFRAKRIREIKQKFLEIKRNFRRISIFSARKALRRCRVRLCHATRGNGLQHLDDEAN